jgi:hypothetical protein
MRKSSAAAARPVIYGRVPQVVHQEIKSAAKRSGRGIAEELAALAHEALERRRQFPDAATARANEMVTLGFLLAGQRTAEQKGLSGPWGADLECRRAAALSACTLLLTQFLSDDPKEQALAVESLKGRVMTQIVNRRQRGEGGQS